MARSPIGNGRKLSPGEVPYTAGYRATGRRRVPQEWLPWGEAWLCGYNDARREAGTYWVLTDRLDTEYQPAVWDGTWWLLLGDDVVRPSVHKVGRKMRVPKR